MNYSTSGFIATHSWVVWLVWQFLWSRNRYRLIFIYLSDIIRSLLIRTGRATNPFWSKCYEIWTQCVIVHFKEINRSIFRFLKFWAILWPFFKKRKQWTKNPLGTVHKPRAHFRYVRTFCEMRASARRIRTYFVAAARTRINASKFIYLIKQVNEYWGNY